MLVCVTLLLTISCAKKDEEAESTQPELTVDTSGPVSKVPADLKFDDQTVNILTHAYLKDELTPEQGAGIIQEEVVKRNLSVEERLGIKLEFYYNDGELSTGFLQEIRSFITAGDATYDLIFAFGHSSALVAEGLFYNVNTVDDHNYISTNLPWYNQSFVKNITYRDQLYMLTGDITLSATDRAPVIFYNEDAAKENNITEDIHQKVVDGEWTIEYLSTLVKNVSHDINSSNSIDKEDFHGFFFNGGSMAIDAMLMASGIELVSPNANGELELVWNKGTSSDAFKKLYDLMYTTDGVYTGTTMDNSYYNKDKTGYYSEQVFFEKRSVFSTGMVSAAREFSKVDGLYYSILPLPKFNADNDYATMPQDGHSVVCIPRHIGKNLQIATATLETLSEYSYKMVRPVYHDVAYKLRYASDEKTGQLFDMIMDSITFDFGCFYSGALNSPMQILRNRLSGMDGNAPTSSLAIVNAQKGSAVKAKLTEFIGLLDNMEQ